MPNPAIGPLLHKMPSEARSRPDVEVARTVAYSAHAPITAPPAAMAQAMAGACPLRNSGAPYAVSAAISANCRATSAVPSRRLVPSVIFSMGSRLQGSSEIFTGVVVAHQHLFSLRPGSRQHQTGSQAAFAAIFQDQLTVVIRRDVAHDRQTQPDAARVGPSSFSVESNTHNW